MQLYQYREQSRLYDHGGHGYHGAAQGGVDDAAQA